MLRTIPCSSHDAQQLHARIAELLEARAPESATLRPEVLARHFTEAGLPARAIEYWQRAGQQATTRSASREAVAHFRKALELLRGLPDTTGRRQQEIALHNSLGGALIHVSGIASQAVEENYVRARQRCENLGDSRQPFLVEWGLCHVYLARAEHVRARELADRLLGLAERENDAELLIQANHAAWSIHNLLGEAAATRAAAERGWTLYDRDKHSARPSSTAATTPRFAGRNIGSWAVWRLGYPDQALAWQEAGLSLAKRQPHPQMLAHAFTWAAFLHQFRRDPVKLREQVELAIGLAREQALANNEAEASMLLGWLMAEEGEPEEGIRVIRHGMTVRESSGTMFHHSYFLGLLAQALARAGQMTEALEMVSEALGFAETRSERWYEPELHRLKGEILAQQDHGNREAIEASLQEAMAIARAQNARSWELRAATSLARLWAAEGRPVEASGLLAPIYDWFEEGFDTPDLEDAKALLMALEREAIR